MNWPYIVLGWFLLLGGFFGMGVAFVRWVDDRKASKDRMADLEWAARPFSPDEFRTCCRSPSETKEE